MRRAAAVGGTPLCMRACGEALACTACRTASLYSRRLDDEYDVTTTLRGARVNVGADALLALLLRVAAALHRVARCVIAGIRRVA